MSGLVNQIVSWTMRVNKIIISKLMLYAMCNLNVCNEMNTFYNRRLADFYF